MEPETIATLGTYGPLIVMVALFYFLLYRPHKKQETIRKDMINRLKKGTHVMTIGGIYGDVVSIDKKTVRIKIAENVEVEVANAAISGDFALPNEVEEKK